METSKKSLSYIGLIFVIVLWGVSPLVTLFFYQYYSPTIRVAFNSLVGAVALLIISWKKLKQLNKTYFLVGGITGLFLTLAHVLQSIGLQYTTPTHFSFLENLSVLVVPFLSYMLIKKKPSFLTIFAAVLCLFSSFILTGLFADKNPVSFTGDLLCAIAGILYGVNIAGTGAYAKKFYAPLYLMIQMAAGFIFSMLGAVFLELIGIEKILFTINWWVLPANILCTFIISTLCWLIRTNAMKHIDASVVAVMMPFSSVVTTILSIITGNDKLTPNLVLGVVLGLVAIILSGLGDHKK